MRLLEPKSAVAALKAAAEPTRLRILALLANGELTVTDLTGVLGQSQPRVSRHLKLLFDAGLIDRFREPSEGCIVLHVSLQHFQAVIIRPTHHTVVVTARHLL